MTVPRPNFKPIVAILLFILGMWQFTSAIDEREFHRDEARWIHRAEYLRELMHPFGDYWEPWTWANGDSMDARNRLKAQPPLGSYLMGLGFLLQGQPIPDIGYWNMDYDTEWNATQGNLPTDEMLTTARRTTATLGALTVAMVFLIGTRLTNLPGAAIGSAYLAVHPLARYLSTFAGSDAALVFFIAASTLAAARLAEKPTWTRAILLGILIGCGASTKLSPFGIAAALAGWGVVILALHWLDKLKSRRLGWMLLSTPIVAALTFVLSYPYLWDNTIRRSKEILDYRTDGMEIQGELWQQVAVSGPNEAIERIWNRFSSAEWSVLGRFGDVGSSIELWLAVVGAGILGGLLFRRGITSSTALIAVSLGAIVAVTVIGMKVDWARYHFPILLAMSVSIGVATGSVVQAAGRLRSHRSELVER